MTIYKITCAVRNAASMAFALIGLNACGSLPDLKVTVAEIPQAVQKLSVFVWQPATPAMGGTSPFSVSKEPLLFDVPAATTPTSNYDFGLQFQPGRDSDYQISVAGFSHPTTAGQTNLLCLHFFTNGTIVAPFNQLSGITLVAPSQMDLLYSLNPTMFPGRCYTTLDGKLPPRIAGISLAVARLTDGSSQPPTQFALDGWGFDPGARVTVKLNPGPTESDVPVTTTPLSAGELNVRPTTLSLAALRGAGSLQFTVTNPDGSSATDAVSFGL